MHEKHGCRSFFDRPHRTAGLQVVELLLKEGFNDELRQISAQEQSGGPVLQLGLRGLQGGEQGNTRH